jgi:hypothetical protein
MILDATIKTHVTFDAACVQHRIAYTMLRVSRQQHPTLRFVLEEGYSSVLHMMQDKVAAWACRDDPRTVLPLGVVGQITGREAPQKVAG